MAKSTSSKVLVNRGGDRPIYEATAGGAITPGMKIALDWTADPPTATASPGTGLNPFNQLYIAVENPRGDAAEAISDAYASGDVVYYVVPQKGDVVNALCAVGTSLSVGDIVIDGGTTTAGTFDEVSPATPDATVIAGTMKGFARTAVTGGAAVVRFEMEVL